MSKYCKCKNKLGVLYFTNSQCYRQWVYKAPLCIPLRIKTWVVAYFDPKEIKQQQKKYKRDIMQLFSEDATIFLRVWLSLNLHLAIMASEVGHWIDLDKDSVLIQICFIQEIRWTQLSSRSSDYRLTNRSGFSHSADSSWLQEPISFF